MNYEKLINAEELPRDWLLFGNDTGSQVSGRMVVKTKVVLNIANNIFSKQEVFNLAMIMLKLAGEMEDTVKF